MGACSRALVMSLWMAGSVSVAAAAQSPHAQVPREWSVIQTHCLGCHNTTDWAGGLSLEGVSFQDVAADPATWEDVVRKVRTGMMPPPGEPRPARAGLERLAGAIEARIDAGAAGRPQPGRKSLHRLNRTEYRNAIRDLLGLDVDVALLLPADDAAGGFDNVADVLAVSPTLVQAYIGAAMKISRAAVGDMAMAPVITRYAAPGGAAQNARLDGLPLGTRGGLRFTHVFPLDARYEFRIATGGGQLLSGGAAGPAPRVDILLDGKPLSVEDPSRFALQLDAGPHTLAIGLVEPRHAPDMDELFARTPGRRVNLSQVTIQGPFEATGAGDTRSRRAIFSCQPSQDLEESACARQILTRLASTAYRRPLEPADPSLQVLMQFYETGRAQGGFETGIQHAIARILVEPQFLFRIESDRADLPPGSVHRVSGVELASRLSFFLWSSLPDAQLLAAAREGALQEPRKLAAEVRRMLADPRSAALVDNFGGQWLGLRQLAGAQPLDAGFDEGLRAAMEQETRLFFGTVKEEDRSVLELLDADFTFLNERLARHYGIEGVRGPQMRRVSLPPDSPRRGLLGKGSILTVTSAGNRTSPVMRGVWVLERLLGAHVPQPPPGVEADLVEEHGGSTPTTVRQRLEQHRANPTCASCHQVMDPLGFAMENFDLVGRWRTEDAGIAVDAGDTLADGTRIEGVAALRTHLLGHADSFATGFAESLLAYALGRRLEPHDQVAVRRIVADARREQLKFSALVLAIVNSAPFQMKTTAEAAAPTLAASAHMRRGSNDRSVP